MGSAYEKIFLELFHKDLKIPEYACPPGAYELKHVAQPDYELYRSWHDAVGAPFGWHNRARIQDRPTIEALLASEVTAMHLFLHDSQAVGYSLIEHTAAEGTELSDFGLLPSRTGQGLGTKFLSMLLDHLFSFSTPRPRIRLSTRSTNHPKVVPFYERFGFQIYKTERHTT